MATEAQVIAQAHRRLGVLSLEEALTDDMALYGAETLALILAELRADGLPIAFVGDEIADGLALGFVSYPALKWACGRGREVRWPMAVLAVVMVLYFALVRSRMG